MRRAFSGAWKFHARSGISTARPHYGISTFLWNFHAPKDGSYVESGRLGEETAMPTVTPPMFHVSRLDDSPPGTHQRSLVN